LEELLSHITTTGFRMECPIGFCDTTGIQLGTDSGFMRF
jgi:hypothetical protein